MKRFVLLLVAAFFGALGASAQDLIVKTDSTRIEARVLEIAPESIRYKRFSNPEGPTYLLPTAEVCYIRYANGEMEYYTRPAAVPAPLQSDASTASTGATAATPAASDAAAGAPAVPYVLKEYEIGDLYDRDGVKGVVCLLSEDKLHGLVISLDEIYLPWSSFRKPDLRLIGTDDRKDGRQNMARVARYIEENNLSWEDFPAFKWCLDQGEGWYLPSIDELLTIGHNYNGGTRMHNDRQARNRFNGALKDAGGERMDRMVFYFSSTELDEKSAYTTHMSLEPPYVVEIPKYNKFLVRAVHRF